MPEYLAPGVFVEEVSFRAKSIEGVSTSTAGFVGATCYGPTDIEPDLITSLVEFERVYGGRQQLEFNDAGGPIDNYMWNAVAAFLQEGGQRCYVARAFKGDAAACCARVTGAVPPANIAIRARFPGQAGELRVRLQLMVSQNRLVTEPDGLALKASADRDVVYVGGVTNSGVYVLSRDVQKDEWTFEDKAGATFELQSLAAGATVRTITATVYVEPSQPGLPFFAAAGLALDRGHKTGGKPDSIFDYFAAEPASLSAARSIPIVIAALTVAEAKAERDAAQVLSTAADNAHTARQADVTTANTKLTDANDPTKDPTKSLNTAQAALAAAPPNTSASALAVLQKAVDDATEAVKAAVDAANAAISAATKAEADSAKAKGQAKERLDAAEAVFTSAAADATPRSGAQLVSDYESSAASDNRFLMTALDQSTGEAPFLDATFFLTGGSDGAIPDQDSYKGEENSSTNRKSGLKAFEDIEDISIVAAPGSSFNDSNAQEVANVLIGHARRMQYRIAVVDSIRGQPIAETRAYRAQFDTSHAAFYYPWVRIIDPNSGQENFYPPSGFVAGIYARNDIERGVHKAPANEVVTLALGFEKPLSKEQQGVLNPEGINCLRSFKGRGHLVWGARTMSSDPEWKYVNLRRYFAYLERSIDKGTQWAVFEPNGEHLWANVRRTIQDFLFNEWQNGALLGDKPEKAFFVKCDRSTMNQNDLDNGRLVCLVGVAALRPAEFVIIRIGQQTADSKS
jgi:phage tail sheath protein FI